MDHAKQFTGHLMRVIAKSITKMLPPKFLFTLLVFGEGEPGISNYISNCSRDDMIKALRETADRLERNEDNPRTL